jgi:phenylacetate-CoA ligase
LADEIMNQLLNPILFSKILKSYVFDVGRLWRLDEKNIKKFQEKRILNIFNNAYNNVPSYRKKYQNTNISLDEIRNFNDFKKVPLTSKDDFRKKRKKDLISPNLENKVFKTTTSGTTGEPASIYVTMYDIVQGLFGYLRFLKEHEINWRKDKIAFLLDLRNFSAEKTYLSGGVIPNFKPFFSFDNIRVYSIFSKPENLIKQLNDFQPEFIGGYVGILGHLALFKEKGFGKNISPKLIGSTGTPLDRYLRRFIEDTFKTKIYDAYGATESGPIAFECRKKRMHICSDLVYTETINNKQEKPGNLVITKLYGEGTPIIRYTGIDDVIAISQDKCDCGLGGSLIKKIYGRESLSLVFPEGKIMLPSAINEIFSKVLYEYKTRMITRRQIIQRNLKEVKVKLIIDSKLQEGVPKSKIFSMIKDSFFEKIGSDSNVVVKIKEVEKIDQDKLIISNVNKNQFKELTYL